MLRAARRGSPGAPTFEAGLATTLAGLRAMEGRFDRGARAVRRLGRRLRRVRPPLPARCPLDRSAPRSRRSQATSRAAERELRTGYTMLEEMGERARPLDAGRVPRRRPVRPRATTSRPSGFVEIARETAAETDVMPQVLWRRALARTTRAARRLGACGGEHSHGAPSRSPRRRTASTSAPARSSRSARCCRGRETTRPHARPRRGAGALRGARGTSQRCEARRRSRRVRALSFHSGDDRRTITSSRRRWAMSDRTQGPEGRVRGKLQARRSPTSIRR